MIGTLYAKDRRNVSRVDQEGQKTTNLSFSTADGQGTNEQVEPVQNQRARRRADTTSRPSNGSVQRSRPLIKVKVELCKNYISTGGCPYGIKCRFAHGVKELLQNSELNGNFRTKNCKAFYVNGQCRYGDRCNFKHDDRTLDDIHRNALTDHYNMLTWYPQLITCLTRRPMFQWSKLDE